MKRKLADVLWEAANKRLSSDDRCTEEKVTATCCAAWWAEHGHEWWDGSDFLTWQRAMRKSKAVQFLKSLGCPVGATSAFRSFDLEQRQGVRYMWLLLAMHVAEDEGIEL